MFAYRSKSKIMGQLQFKLLFFADPPGQQRPLDIGEDTYMPVFGACTQIHAPHHPHTHEDKKVHKTVPSTYIYVRIYVRM